MRAKINKIIKTKIPEPIRILKKPTQPKPSANTPAIDPKNIELSWNTDHRKQYKIMSRLFWYDILFIKTKKAAIIADTMMFSYIIEQ